MDDVILQQEYEKKIINRKTNLSLVTQLGILAILFVFIIMIIIMIYYTINMFIPTLIADFERFQRILAYISSNISNIRKELEKIANNTIHVQ